MPLLTFEQAIANSEQFSKRHLLLGNGFSIACRADIFHYGSLYDQADFSGIPEVEAVFAALGTRDFEAVIRTLESAATILPAYVVDGGTAPTKMREHATMLKEILVQTIAGNHPHLPSGPARLKWRAGFRCAFSPGGWPARRGCNQMVLFALARQAPQSTGGSHCQAGVQPLRLQRSQGGV